MAREVILGPKCASYILISSLNAGVTSEGNIVPSDNTVLSLAAFPEFTAQEASEALRLIASYNLELLRVLGVNVIPLTHECSFFNPSIFSPT